MARYPFTKFRNSVLVETGTYKGDGVQAALNAGFERVISFEVVESLYQEAQLRFKDDARVQLVHGSSARLLYENIRTITEPITFWLDGHYSTGVTGYDPDYICPLLQELEQIKRHGSHHTILIDDRRLFHRIQGAPIEHAFGIDEWEIRAKLLEINPQYKLSYEDGHVPNDIIVAQP
jgi:hypothetical protein